MIKTFLKYDYCLAEWFVPKKRVMGIEPMVSFIFLGKVAFIFLPVYFALEHLLNLQPSTNVFVLILMGVVGVITYGFQKTVWKLIKEYELTKEYKHLSKREKRKRNFIGFSVVIIVYFGSLYVLLSKSLIRLAEFF